MEQKFIKATELKIGDMILYPIDKEFITKDAKKLRYILATVSDRLENFEDINGDPEILANCFIPLDAKSEYQYVGKKITPTFEEKHDFGWAIKQLKEGKKVARNGWNGKGMFLWLKPGTTIKAEWCKDPALKTIIENNGGEMEGLGTVCMKTADNKILTGWLASQTDMLSEDWVEV